MSDVPRGTGAVKWISTDWLLEHHQDQGLVIVDTQPDVHDYIKAHIAGAVYLAEKTMRGYWHSVPAEWIAAEGAQSLIQRLGLSADTPIVVYTGTGLVKGWGDGLEQTMTAYSLVRYGLKHVHVLDGGLNKWLKEGKPTSQVFPTVEDSQFAANVQSDLFLTYEQFKAIKDRDDVIVLDARPANVYAGEAGPWIRNGHIPGSISLPWRGLMDADNPALLRPEAELRQIIAGKGVIPDKTVICSCGTGREATNEFILFKYLLGYPRVKLNEGAYTRWSADPENPVVTGPNLR
jgi:thiosulfate/3-mercaptopyruvate sulfurtransferase